MKQPNFKKLSRELSNTSGISNSLILLIILTFLVSMIFWAKNTELDNVTRGEGKIVSKLQNQLVQASEAGVIKQRLVKENNLVAKGDILFEIDPIDAVSELSRLVQREATLSITEARLKAEISNTSFQVSEAHASKAPEFADNELQLFNARKQELDNQKNILEQSLLKAMAELASAEDSKVSAENLLELVISERKLVEPLVIEKIAPETRLLELKREQERAKFSKLQSQTKIETSKISITELKQRLGALQNEYRSEALALLSQTIADRRELLKALPSIKERVNRSTVRSPMDGIINRVNYRTDGAYVSVGDILLELVPTDEGLKLEGRINPKDISKIAIGDSAKIRLSAYDSAKYGSIKGIVTSISPDAIIPKQGDGEAYYAIDVTWEETLQLSTGEYITLIPGMTASVDVVSGKRSVLDYFWAPISRLQELALRD